MATLHYGLDVGLRLARRLPPAPPVKRPRWLQAYLNSNLYQ